MPTIGADGARARGFLVAAVLTAAAPAALARPGEPVTYTLRFPAPHTHYVAVEARVPTGGRPEVELMMAVWTPGSYLIREYARHVEAVTARTPDGARLRIGKSRKNRWRAATGGADAVVVSYRVYGREMSVRTNWIDADFAMLNGAPTFLTLADDDGPRPHDVFLELPAAWSGTATALPPHPGGAPRAWRARDFDTLVDSPIVAGNPTVYAFRVAGVPHQLVNIGESGTWDGPRSAEDAERITRELHRMWGLLPYERYRFLNLITEAGGGLEHRDSTLLMTSRRTTSSRPRYLRWLGLVSHELFHAWNGKRLRPVELGPFDYEAEVHTESLWVVEGLTSYYADLAVHRAGLSTEAEYLEALSRQIRDLQTTPGRTVQPLATASWDAWIKFYRGDENSRNTSVSYYTKGAVVGFLLDMRIRAVTDGAATLDDVLRRAYARYSGERGFTPHEFRAEAEAVAGESLADWFAHALDSTGELDYAEALDRLGLTFGDASDAGDEEDGWIGAVTRTVDGRLLVARVPRGTPAHAAGFNVDDEILAVGDHRVLPSDWSARLAEAGSGARLDVLVSRRGALRRIPVETAAPPARRWELRPADDPTPAQQRNREAWLSGG